MAARTWFPAGVCQVRRVRKEAEDWVLPWFGIYQRVLPLAPFSFLLLWWFAS